MAEANWYWAEGENRNGPVTPAAIARLVADGKLGAEDLIWKEGMAEWIPVKKVPALVKYLKKPESIAAATPAAPAAAVEPAAPPAATVAAAKPRAQAAKKARVAVAEPVAVVEEAPIDSNENDSPVAAAAAVGYYNPAGSLPPRAAATLARHSPPRGDIGDWPLDDARVTQFDVALKLRKRIDGAASLFRLLLLLAVLGDVGSVALVAVTFATSRGPSSIANVIPMGISLAVSLGVTALYYFAWKGTTRSQIWAPLTMGILFVLGGLGYAGILYFAAMTSPRDASSIYIVAAIIAFLAGVFAYVAFRAFAAIPKYLLQPAWCQELLSKTSA